MIYAVRLVVILLILEFALCGYLVSNKLLRDAPAIPAFYLDDPLLRKTYEKLSIEAQAGGDLEWQHLAEALMGHGYYSHAVLNYEHALKLNPGNIYARFGLAFCFDKMSRTEESTNQYRQFIYLATGTSQNQKHVFYAKYAIGRNYLREEEIAAAEKEFRANTSFIPAEYQLAKILIRSGRALEALPIIDKNREKLPRSIAFNYLNYLAMQELNRSEEAQAAKEITENSKYLVSLHFNSNYVDPFYLKYGQEIEE